MWRRLFTNRGQQVSNVPKLWAGVVGADRQEFLRIARRAIVAMREPTSLMLEPIDRHIYIGSPTYEMKCVWQAMIDAALKED